MRQSGKVKTTSLWGASGFTLVELIATVAIVAMLAVVLVVFIGGYIADAKRTADRQTLAVLNDALTRYKTQGGSLAALTVGADIQNVLTELRTPISWAGMQHQVLKEGDTYASEDISVSGNGSSYKFTRYGSFIDGSSYASNIVSDVGGIGDSAAFETWMANAMIETGSTNYLALTNPDTTDRFGIYARVANSGDKVRVWWGDGTTENFDSISTSSSTVIAKNFGSSAARTIVIVGNVDYLRSNNETDLGGSAASNFGGDISTMTSLIYILVGPYNTLSGDVSGLTNLITLSLHDNNSITGDITRLTKLTTLRAYGTNTLSGDISGITGLTLLVLSGNNTVTGDITAMNSLEVLLIAGNSTITGNIAGMPLQFLSLGGNSTIDVDSIVSVSATATGLSSYSIYNNYTLTQTQVDAILANFWANRDEYKPRNDYRGISIYQPNHAIPSAAGLANKANLESYMSPNNTGPMVWEVQTN